MEFLSTLTFTAIKRPYVVAFLLSYLFLAYKLKGPRFTFLFLITGYSIAFLSEYSSINTGFPYGWYFYKYENLAGEWLNHGVPVWDSVSYVFMNFAGLCFATLCIRNTNFESTKQKTKLMLAASFAVVLLDVVIDPAAHQGARWFLGDIYYYPKPGFYFDVPLSNFAGWFLVCLGINAIGIFVLHFSKNLDRKTAFLKLGGLLYLGIMLFGLSIAIYLNEAALIICDLVVILCTTSWLRFKSRSSSLRI